MRVTGIFNGLFEAPIDVTVTVPLYVPAARPAPFTETVTAPGVAALAGVTESQEPMLVVEMAE